MISPFSCRLKCSSDTPNTSDIATQHIYSGNFVIIIYASLIQMYFQWLTVWTKTWMSMSASIKDVVRHALESSCVFNICVWRLPSLQWYAPLAMIKNCIGKLSRCFKEVVYNSWFLFILTKDLGGTKVSFTLSNVSFSCKKY